ncbi:CPBP family intramembrane glutamic endopeptidase [Bacillus massilinigeriensis]|uniref:CPBP family intramembrane glutamic endopeptidase n=1 Tax=Bacillus massilionigeriensis TaxID=1805475 RepID=UPI00096B31C7|nr:type II CAAX endopeptidase family protein [Bacillus massilionigeriensis]
MKLLNIQFLSYIQASIFILVVYLFQVQLFNLMFILILGLLLFVPLLSEDNRLFTWTTIAFLIGQFFYLYGDRLILNLHLTREWEIIGSRMLILFPILLIVLLCIKFKRKVTKYPLTTKWNQALTLPFHFKEGSEISIKRFLVLVNLITIIIFVPIIIQNSHSLSYYGIAIIILFSMINSLFEEYLWRGLLLSRFSSIIGEKSAVLFTSIGFGLMHLSFGYSINACLLFLIEGLFLALLTVKSRGLVPAITWHFLFNVCMILSERIPLWIS